MMSRIFLIIVAAFLFFVLFFSACAPAATPAPQETSAGMAESTAFDKEQLTIPAATPESEFIPTPQPTQTQPQKAPVGEEYATSAAQALTTSTRFPDATLPPVTPYPTGFQLPTSSPFAPPSLPESRQVSVQWPPVIRLGESDLIRLTLIPHPPAYVLVTELPDHQVITQTVSVTPIEGYDLYVIARLTGVSFQIAPSGDQEQFLLAGEPLQWRWSVSPQVPGRHHLSLDLRLKWVPTRDLARRARELTVFSAGLDVRVVSFLGLTQPQALLSGVLGLLFGSSLSLFAIVFRPPSPRTIQNRNPNPALRLELPAGLQLSSQETTLLQSLFNRYDRLVIEGEFLSGYSGARTFLALPIRSNGRSDAYTIAKLGEKSAIRKEFANYEEFVKDTLPPVTARIQQPPVALAPGVHRRLAPGAQELAALQYTFIGEPGKSPLSLRQALQASLDPAILNKLLDTFGHNWWLQRRPYTFRIAQEYDRLLPTHLVIEPGSKRGKTLDGSDSPADINLHPGDRVMLRNFTIAEVRLDGKSLSLTGRGKLRSPVLRVRWLSRSDPEGKQGRIVATRQTLLQDLVSGLDLLDLPDPLERLPSLLDQTISGSQSIIHGDLNLENILLGPGEILWLIDFAQTREGHSMFDFAHLEAEIIAHLLASRIANPVEYLDMWRDPGSSPHRSLFDFCEALHQIALRCLLDSASPQEYWLVLAVTCLGALKFANLDNHSRNLLYLTAAHLLS